MGPEWQSAKDAGSEGRDTGSAIGEADIQSYPVRDTKWNPMLQPTHRSSQAI